MEQSLQNQTECILYLNNLIYCLLCEQLLDNPQSCPQQLLCPQCQISCLQNQNKNLFDKMLKNDYQFEERLQQKIQEQQSQIKQNLILQQQNNEFQNTIQKQDEIIQRIKIKNQQLEQKMNEQFSQILQCQEIQNQKIIELEKFPKFKQQIKNNFNLFSKIYQNEKIENLQLSNWKLIHNKLYDEPTDFNYLQSLNNHSDHTIVCVGAVSENILILGAIDKLHNIIRETKDINKAIQGENNVFWYNIQEASFGFSDEEKINIDYADENEGEKRLSWFNCQKLGGYRIGNLKDLHYSKEYRKMIWILE